MPPHRRSRAHTVSRDELIVTALLLRVENVAADRERGPSRPDRTAPEFLRRGRHPVGFDLQAANHAISAGPRKPGPCGAARLPGPRQLAVSAFFTSIAGTAVSGLVSAAAVATPRCWRCCRRRACGFGTLCGTGGSGCGASPPWASRRSSGVIDHRQRSSDFPPLRPSVRTSAQRRAHDEERHNQRHTPDGLSRIPRSDGPRHQRERQQRGCKRVEHHAHHPADDRGMKDEARERTSRSPSLRSHRVVPSQGARLRNSHHRMINSAPATAPMAPISSSESLSSPSGTTAGSTNRRITTQCREDDPGHQAKRLARVARRRGCRGRAFMCATY